MLRDKLNKLLSPYVEFKFNTEIQDPPLTVKDYKDDLAFILTKDIVIPDIHRSIEQEGINEKDYVNTYTMAASDMFFTYDSKWKFYLNGKSIYTYDDVKMIIINGYVYILSKTLLTIESFIIISTELDITLSSSTSSNVSEDNGHNLVLNYTNNFVYNETETNGKSITIKGRYLSITAGQTIFDALTAIQKPMEYLFSINILKILLVDTITGISKEYGNLEIKPMIFKLNNTNPNLKCFFFYEGLDPIAWQTKDAAKVRSFYEIKYPNILKEEAYLEHLLCRIYDDTNLRQLFLDNLDNLHPTWNDVIIDIQEHDRKSDYTLTRYLLDFNYDLFMDSYKIKHKVQHVITYNDIKFVKNNKSIKIIPANLATNYWKDSFIKFSFDNFIDLPFDIYFFDKLYTSHYTKDRDHQVTNIYIRLDNFTDFYNITIDDLPMLNGIIVLKPENYTTIDYVNVGVEFNGTLMISKDLFSLNGIKVYDNGYLLKTSDYSINNIPPVNMLAMFPKRRLAHHSIRVTGFEGKHFVTKKIIHVKIKNFTPSEETDIVDNNPVNMYLYKNFLYTDYIDFRYQIFIGPTCLIENVDYIINSPTCIEFIKPITIYIEDIDLEYIDITIEYNGNQENRLLEMIDTKSYRNRLFTNKMFREALYDSQSDIHGLVLIDNDNLGNDCPPLYPEPAFRLNMMVTKFYSTEVLITTDVDDYGTKWFDDLKTEFPDLVKFNVDNNDDEILMECTPDYPISDYPRLISLPERLPLNMVMYNHIVADYKLNSWNYKFMKDIPHDNNVLHRKTYMADKIDLTFVNGDFFHNPNIPINYVIDDSI